jgi:hypothetical protein
LDELARRDHRGVPKDDDQIALAASYYPQHAEAVLGVVKGDAIDLQTPRSARGAKTQRSTVSMEITKPSI